MSNIKRIIYVTVIFIFVFIPSSLISKLEFFESFNWLPRAGIVQLLLLIISTTLILILSKGNWATYGFKFIKIKELFKPILVSVIAQIILKIIITFIIISTKAKAGHPGITGMSFFQVIVFVFFLASIAEEFLFRSLIQTSLFPLKNYHIQLFKINISFPVIMSSFLFAISHLGLMIAGAGTIFTLNIVFMTFILGLIAGYYRESLGSIIPAIATHMTFNFVGGVIPLFIKNMLLQ